MSRFDYIKYDEASSTKQEIFKALFEKLETVANDLLGESRYKSLLMTKLEEAYMFVGKAIRDEQISRGSQIAHLQERSDS